MDFGLADDNEINGVNLANYLPYQSSGDTVLYVHKRVLKEEAEQEAEREKKAKKKNKANNLTSKCNETGRDETVLEQTVRFAKHLAPIVIPPSDNTPVFYTVETCSKCRRKEKPKVLNDNTYEKRKCKKIIETYRNDRKLRKQLHSTTESLTHSSQSNTLDDLNMNQSLNGTLSEQSEKQEKYVKNEVNKRKRNKDKFIISESLEAIGNELVDSDESKIKVQLMNNAEKNAFCDSIRSPIVDAVRECLSEFNYVEVQDEIKTVQRVVKHNTDKLDKILDRLANIEKHIKEIGHRTKSPRKVSTLEQLGEDIDEKSDEYEMRKPEDRVDLGCGEVVSIRPTTSVGVKTDKPNRIPARYCWTDANKD